MADIAPPQSISWPPSKKCRPTCSPNGHVLTLVGGTWRTICHSHREAPRTHNIPHYFRDISSAFPRKVRLTTSVWADAPQFDQNLPFAEHTTITDGKQRLTTLGAPRTSMQQTRNTAPSEWQQERQQEWQQTWRPWRLRKACLGRPAGNAVQLAAPTATS